MVCWSIPVHPCLCLGQKLHFPARYDCFEKEKQGRMCMAAEEDQTAQPNESQGVPTAVPHHLPVPAAVASAAAQNHKWWEAVWFPTPRTSHFQCPGWHWWEDDESRLWKKHAAASSILHSATKPHLALAQGAALLTDTASSWAILPPGDWGLQGCLFVPQCMEWHSSQIFPA